jgi:hypothetical protein
MPTQAQLAAIGHLCDRLATEPDDYVIQNSPDLPAEWITVTVGTRKGRPKTIDLSPNGPSTDPTHPNHP